MPQPPLDLQAMIAQVWKISEFLRQQREGKESK
jgi:hypothetical protein